MQASDTTVLPWHESEYAALWDRRERLPHALLIHGRQGTGKLRFATALAQALLCEKPGAGRACGACPSCNWFAGGSHPDFMHLEPVTEDSGEEEGATGKKRAQITVEQVRALSGFLSVSTHRGGWRPVLLHPAEGLNPSAANALLKSLEEPPARTIFILVGHRLHQVLPTIKSRCQLLPLASPSREEAGRWLDAQGVSNAGLASAYSGGAPLTALAPPSENFWEMRQRFVRHLAAPRLDPLSAADECQDAGIPLVLEWLQKWTYDIAACRLGAGLRYNVDQEAAISRLASGSDPIRVLRMHRELVRMQRHANHPLNARLFVEQVLMSYAEATAAGPPSP